MGLYSSVFDLVLRGVAVAAVSVFSASCATSQGGAEERFRPTGFSLVLLATGDHPEAASEDLTQRQFEFMEGLAAEGKLLLAGPFGPDKHRPDLHGLFIIDESDPEAARALVIADPRVQAEELRQEVVPMTTLDVIRYLPQVEQRRQERRLASGESPDQPDVRAYTVLMAPEGERAAAEVFSNPAIGEVVVLIARMGPPREGELFAILDVPTASEARARLKVANTSDLEISVSEWYSSPALVELVTDGGPPLAGRSVPQGDESGLGSACADPSPFPLNPPKG